MATAHLPSYGQDTNSFAFVKSEKDKSLIEDPFEPEFSKWFDDAPTVPQQTVQAVQQPVAFSYNNGYHPNFSLWASMNQQANTMGTTSSTTAPSMFNSTVNAPMIPFGGNNGTFSQYALAPGAFSPGSGLVYAIPSTALYQGAYQQPMLVGYANGNYVQNPMNQATGGEMRSSNSQQMPTTSPTTTTSASQSFQPVPQLTGINQGTSQSLSSSPQPQLGMQQSSNMQAQPMMLPNFSFPQQMLVTQFVPYNTQFQQLAKSQTPALGDEASEDRKRPRKERPATRRVRQTRPKVVEAKGAIQCRGKNRKKNSQCRNAALMEYIGPRPIYCAEHIELDPNSFYEKCKSPYQKEPGDKKGCKEVVLKEFGLCYKHFGDLVAELERTHDLEKAREHLERINHHLEALEREASDAKKKDGDLFQRKNKLIPKFQEMKRSMVKCIEHIEQPDRKEAAGDDLSVSAEMFNVHLPVLNLSVSTDDFQTSGSFSSESGASTPEQILEDPSDLSSDSPISGDSLFPEADSVSPLSY